MLNTNQLAEMKAVDITQTSVNTLIDIGSVEIDVSMPISQRMMHYLNQIKNPYCFLCEGIPIKIEFANAGSQLDEKLRSYFIELKNR